MQSAYRGHPVLGDQLYGRASAKGTFVPRLCLHCLKLAFAHPMDPNVRVAVSAPLPDELASFVSSEKSAVRPQKQRKTKRQHDRL